MRTLLLVILFLAEPARGAQAQPFGDPAFYLLDSVQPATIQPADRQLLDSLLHAYHQTSTDTGRLVLLNEIVENVWDDVWLRYNERLKIAAEHILQTNPDTRSAYLATSMTAQYFANRAYQFQITGQTDSVAGYFARALAAAETVGNDELMGYTYMSLGGFMADQGKLTAALEAYEQAVPRLQTVGNYDGLGRVYYALTIPQIELGNPAQAFIYGELAIQNAERAGDRGTVGATHSILGLAELAGGRVAAARTRAHRALRAVRGDTDLANSAAVYGRAATIFERLELYDRARAGADTSLLYARQVGSLKEIINGLLLIGRDELRSGALAAAESLAQEAVDYAQQLDYLKERQVTHDFLAMVLHLQGKDRAAFLQLKQATVLKDSLVSSDHQKAALAQGVKFRYERQKVIDDLANAQRLALADTEKRQRTRLLWLALATALLAGLGAAYIFTRLRIIRRQKQALDAAYAELETRKRSELAASNLQALQSQMNPHFIFNALNSVQDLVLLQDIRGSNRYLGMFSDLLRKILLASRQQYILLAEELDMLTLYLDLEKLRFGDELDYRITTALPDGYADAHRLPAMFVQPFVENALKHGLFHQKGEKRLTIHFDRSADYLRCTVEDNGIGRARAAVLRQRQPSRNAGFSTRAAEERVRLLNQTLSRPLRIETTDRYDAAGQPAGTRVVLWFPPLSDRTEGADRSAIVGL